MSVRYHIVPPPPQLADAVRFFWVFEIDGIAGSPYVYRSMADGCAEMVFHFQGTFDELRGDTQIHSPLAHFHAQTAHHRRFVTHQDFGILGVYLYPYSLPRLFGLSASALSNELPDLATLCGQEGQILVEQIMTATDTATRIAHLSDFLLRRWERGKPGHLMAQQAVLQMIAQNGQVPVATLSASMGISTRQLERQFHDYAGFSPKTYARILRFQATLKRFGHRDTSLTEIALDCGYYDQAHFIHDFQQFSGYVPGEYFNGRPEGVEYREV